jgi:predicted O-linked N-acetylglucosamine transferase (SPINDLY family)
MHENNTLFLEEKFQLIDKLIQLEEFSPALSLLKNLESKLDAQESLKHEKLMMQILSIYRRMRDLEKDESNNLELAFLYLGFHKFPEAHQIFLHLYTNELKNHNVIYGLAKSLHELQEDISFLINDLEEITDLREKEQQELYSILGTVYYGKDDNKALLYFGQELTLNPEDPAINLKIAALTFRKTKNIFSVEEYIPHALRITNEERYMALYLGIILAEAKKDKIAPHLTDELIHNFPDSELSYLFRSERLCTEDLDESIKILREAVIKYPGSKTAHDNLIMNCQYTENISNEENLSFAQNYYEGYVLPFIKSQNISFDFKERLKEKKTVINIGFVSGDFKIHPVFFWITSLFNNVPKNEFRIFCYANNEINTESELLKKIIHKLEYVEALSDKELAETIYQDKIDILVDLSGHTTLNRLEVFALKPAPLQVTWLGQSGPMGLPEIDYALTDKFLIKEGEDHFHTEKIYRMSHSFAPYPAKEYFNLTINENLAQNDGSIILASLNSAMKVNNTVLKTWAKILSLTPQSKILIKNHRAVDPEYQRRIYEIFENENIDRQRITFENMTEKGEYLNIFHKIDISLDPFPLGGNTTTHETLMLSVPMIALKGKRVAHRTGESVLSNAGLSELISLDQNDYITKAVNLINDPAKIIAYKKNIRKQYLNSAATDIETFSVEFFTVLKNLFEMKVQSYLSNSD